MDGDQKIAKFIDLGPKTVSVVAFHNVFSQQLRDAFIIGAFYPALTAACALGERILNHLVIALRHYYTHTPEYKRIFRKKSIDNWETAVGILEA